jgi:hypothetical protein
MKRLTIIPVLLLALFVASSAFGWTGTWNNLYPFGGHECAPIPPGSLIQLIHAGDNGQQDDPMEWCRAQPDPQQAVNEWLAAGCPPVGDDTLKDETVFIDYGAGYEGYFGKSISGTDDEMADPWYTRFFTAPKGEIGASDWYGEVGDPVNPNDPIYFYGWNGETYDFGDYKIKLQGVCADKQIIPEPSTLLVAAVAMLLGFLRARNNISLKASQEPS